MAQREIEIDPAQMADADKFEAILAKYLAGEVEEDAFRIFRLNNGIYGQRQGGHNQMVRVKIPYGGMLPHQLELMADLADQYSRGWGHITTRQNIQFHYVQLEKIPEVMRLLGAAGMTTREACGDTVRNVQGCHLAGACPYEAIDITAWADATYQHFVRNPLGQRLPRKFKINFSGCATDCGQAMFNDVGVVGTARKNEDGSLERGFRVFVAGGLGANPHPALALEEFTAKEDLMATLEACLRTFDHYGNRDNKLRARMKWLVDTMGWDELQQRIIKERRLLLGSSSWPGGIPEEVAKAGDSPAGLADGVVPTPMGQFRALANIQRDFGLEVRLTNRQNVAFRGLTEEQLPELHRRLEAIDMAEAGAELVRDVVACPGADTCNLAVTQSRGLGAAIGDRLEEEGLGEVGGLRVNISGCTNSCGQHHASDIGFFGVERRANGRPAPGYQMLLGGYVGEERVHFGEKALRLPAKNAPEAAVRVVRRFADERQAGESFREWMDRAGGAKALAATLKELDQFPEPDESPEFYVDYGEQGPYEAVVGVGECAGV